MHRLFRSAARLRARHQTGEGGFTLVEVMVAMLLLAIALTGLAQLAGSQMVASLRTKVREVATAYVNQELESLRSMTYTSLSMDPSDSTKDPSGNTAAGSKTVGTTTYTEVKGTAGCAGTSCLTYSRPVSVTNNQVSGDTFNFTETRWVGQISGAAYKTVFVTITSTSGSGFTYSSQTDVSGATTNNPTAVTALEIDLTQVDSSGNAVDDPTTGLAEPAPDGLTVTVSLNGTTIASGSSSDGSFSVTNGLSTSTAYSCTVTNPGGAGLATWVAYSATDSAFTCSTGTAGTTTSYPSHWKQGPCTADGSTGYLTATVYDTSGALVNGVTVALTASQHQTNPPSVKTGATGGGGTEPTGVANWDGTGVPVSSNVIKDGLYVIKISGGGLQGTQNDLASVCIWSGQTTDITLFGSATGPNGWKNFNLVVPVVNSYPGGTATIALEAVDSTHTYKFETQVDLDGTGCVSHCTGVNVTVPVYGSNSYAVTVNCVGTGGAAPPGSTDGPLVQDGETLGTWNTSTITQNTTGSQISLKCPQS